MPKFRRGAPRPKGAGRRPGSKNLIPLAAKEAVHQALNEGMGAVAYLSKLKKSKIASDRQAFVHLVGKLIPRETVVDADVAVSGLAQPSVKVVLPFNGRCDPSLLGNSAHHETELEYARRIIAEHERAERAAGNDSE